eukprot:TRINITY_DN60378_c1_g2_i1.p1 TRINITY_DN60378_c1_g2~~TRINITY_DN60378_c1_g2_i1.p1  ORF type:complete len:750 (+),score=411.41 TRINITY_DN60378_c1_g2_i1:31-2280(+)
MEFKDRVVIVTGAGGGLGRVYALEYARRGARVVVNDLGGSVRGGDAKGSTRAADKVVEEIRKAGGQAVANYDSVVDGAKVVQTAIDTWGRVDVVVNNAGILRDMSFHKMGEADWSVMLQVHLKGAFAVTRAAWPYMRKQKYGRVVMVSSAAGLYGNFGQAHYSTVKMGLVGFANTLAKEGAKRNIRVSTIAPIAGSRMTETVLPPDMVAALKPEYVAPLVLYLTHESCEETGGIYEVGAGWVSKVRWERSKGAFFPLDSSFSIEAVRSKIGTINNFKDEPTYPSSPQDAFGPIMQNLEAAKSSGRSASSSSSASSSGKKNKNVDYEKVMAAKLPAVPFTYTSRDVILYALGIGAAANPWDPKELRFTYENAADFSVFPTFGVVVPSSVLGSVMTVPGLKFNPMMLLHGEQYMELKAPLPTSGTLTSQPRISALYDKGKGALLKLDVTTTDESGKEVLFNQYSMFIRGLGGFGGDKGPKPVSHAPPQRPPDVVHREQTLENQALLYRLSGDLNPLHADPAMAKMGNFDKPILHGLCTFGYATRAVLKHFCDNDASLFKSINVRFVKHVFPGETLVTEMWRVSPSKIVFRVKVAERGEYVLANAAITLNVADNTKKSASSSSSSSASSSSSNVDVSSFKAAAVFKQLAQGLKARPELVKKVGVVYRFDVKNDAGDEVSWLVDLKNGAGAVRAGDKGKADCIIIMKDADLVKLMTGKLNPQSAFMKGQLKIKGNMMLAQKLGALVQQNKSKL